MSALPDFNSCCEAACIKLWGEPNHRSGNELRWNGADGYSPRTYSFAKKVWYDHATQRGGSTLELAAFAMGWPKDKPIRGADFYAVWQGAYERGLYPHPPPQPGLGDPVEIYDYEDEFGGRLFQVLRFEPPGQSKTFRQRTCPDQEKWSIEGVRRVLFKLPE